ncbi:MAG: DNA methyltransferase [Chloroflexi bacterium]|nr:DNA methyltransferase [Chloroflexota bacterium]
MDAAPGATPQEVLHVRDATVVLDAGDDAREEARRDDLVVVAEFGEPIYPGLRRLGSVNMGGDKPAHIVTKGENYHVLEALRFSHAGKIDCVYIDPPYNTGARDWKYDNDYVDAEDSYRHSKWLAFMERRLRIAKDLLNPDQSVLICTIAEDEVHRLGLMLEQLFPDARIQMSSIVINPSGAGGFGLNRVEEHAFFVWLGAAAPARWTDDLLTDGDDRRTPLVVATDRS